MSIHRRTVQGNANHFGARMYLQGRNETLTKRCDCVGVLVEAEQQVWRSLKCSTATEFRIPSSHSVYTPQAAVGVTQLAASTNPSRNGMFPVPVKSPKEVSGMSRRATLELKLRRLEEEHAQIKQKYDAERVHFQEKYMLLEQTIRAGKAASSRTTKGCLQELGSQKQDTTRPVSLPKASHPSEQSTAGAEQDLHDQIVVSCTTPTVSIDSLPDDRCPPKPDRSTLTNPDGCYLLGPKEDELEQLTRNHFGDKDKLRKGQHGEENANSESCLPYGVAPESSNQERVRLKPTDKRSDIQHIGSSKRRAVLLSKKRVIAGRNTPGPLSKRSDQQRTVHRASSRVQRNNIRSSGVALHFDPPKGPDWKPADYFRNRREDPGSGCIEPDKAATCPPRKISPNPAFNMPPIPSAGRCWTLGAMDCKPTGGSVYLGGVLRAASAKRTSVQQVTHTGITLIDITLPCRSVDSQQTSSSRDRVRDIDRVLSWHAKELT
uniref:(northern house mosquito) hypothetical protein n=1 Tax=Culex pipiens TaxID=7175 RepID=A0A8D8IBV2_CULPI